jgi:hypothetical protein
LCGWWGGQGLNRQHGLAQLLLQVCHHGAEVQGRAAVPAHALCTIQAWQQVCALCTCGCAGLQPRAMAYLAVLWRMLFSDQVWTWLVIVPPVGGSWATSTHPLLYPYGVFHPPLCVVGARTRCWQHAQPVAVRWWVCRCSTGDGCTLHSLQAHAHRYASVHRFCGRACCAAAHPPPCNSQ